MAFRNDIENKLKVYDSIYFYTKNVFNSIVEELQATGISVELDDKYVDSFTLVFDSGKNYPCFEIEIDYSQIISELKKTSSKLVTLEKEKVDTVIRDLVLNKMPV